MTNSVVRLGSWMAVGLLMAGCNASTDTDPDDDDAPTHPAGTAISSVAVTARPFGIAISDNGVLLTSRLDAGQVSRLRLTPDAVAGTVDVGLLPTDVTFGPDGAVAYVSNQASNTVGVVNVAAAVQAVAVPVRGNPFRVIVSPNGTRVYATTNTSWLFVIDAAQRTVIDSIVVPTDANGIALSPNGSLAYLSSPTTGALVTVDLATRQVTRTVQIGGGLQEVVISPSGDELYLARLDGPVEVRRTSDLGLIATVAGTNGGFGMALSPDGVQLYVTLT